MRLELSQNVPGFLSCLLPEWGLSWSHTWLSCLCRFLALCGVSALPKCIWCWWLCDTTRAVGTSVLLQPFLPSHFLLQKLSTPCSFHFIRGPLITPCSTNGGSGPRPQVSLQKGPAQLLSAISNPSSSLRTQTNRGVKWSIYEHSSTLC